MDRYAALKQLQALEFAAVEFNLYLDTHPTDQRALNEYNHLVQRIDEMKKYYECYFGPLLNFGFSASRYPWQWTEEPWPWEL